MYLYGKWTVEWFIALNSMFYSTPTTAEILFGTEPREPPLTRLTRGGKEAKTLRRFRARAWEFLKRALNSTQSIRPSFHPWPWNGRGAKKQDCSRRSLELVLCQFLKITNCKSQFYLPFSECRNCELKNDSSSIHFTILLANDSGIESRHKVENSQGIGIAILLESESTQP